jgi:hypothetical protein
MAVTAYAASGQLALSEFRTTVVGASDSVSMSKLVARNPTTSTTTTDIQYTGTNLPWAGYGTNDSIPERTSGTPTPAIAISDFHGAIPWFLTMRTNAWKYVEYITNPVYDKDGNINIQSPDKGGSGGTQYGAKLTWDNVLVHTLTTSFPTSISTGGFTYYRGPGFYFFSGADPRRAYQIGRD